MASIFLASLLLSQAAPVLAASSEVVIPQEVRALPGALDNRPFLHSNSPELINTGGILLSTFPESGKASPEAHLNYSLTGEFYVFAHHVTRRWSRRGNRSLYQGVLLHNPTSKPVEVKVLQAASYLSSAHAPFVPLAAQIKDPTGKVFSGPGSRIAGVILRDQSQPGWSSGVVVPPRESYMLVNRAIPPSNSRTTWIRLRSNGPLYVASMAKHGKANYSGPSLATWKLLLAKGELIRPRDKVPSPLDFKGQKFIYGRVAGVSKGGEWRGTLTDSSRSDVLKVPKSGKGFSYVINSLHRGTLGTQQIQSAPMLARYGDTAYLSNGNYGLKYDLDLPLHNSTKRSKTVTIALQTPIKEDRLTRKGLRFLKSPAGPPCFRGTIKLSFPDGQSSRSISRPQYFHLVQRCGEQGKPLATLSIAPKATQHVKVELIYPPDSVPPQVLTVRSL
ncbi:hypothetical protein C1752_07478 [Acaryochloris thomasi RCC1774]|uniref:DUF3370 domain-containing protein n=1 Tax=Acaryochloris thomasi RCC1774 TaxID=1764569 RepID=A0A2W1JJH9_9CYAN|nr:DUF3370 domain-containing protein [Acaryochloris thomasi]PZD71202.1 hypothetical protein C1752_07478 [Acaryochloris thomasi RCC1774]